MWVIASSIAASIALRGYVAGAWSSKSADLPTDPYRLSKLLRYELSGWRVPRRGDYRVTFRILEDDRVLFIGRIEHRAHVYRRQ